MQVAGSDTVESISLKDISKICRLCLKGFIKPFDNDELLGIFDDHEDEDFSVKMTDLMDEFLQIKVRPCDNLPQNICVQCCELIWKFHSFKVQSKIAETTLKFYMNFMENNTKQIEEPQCENIEKEPQQEIFENEDKVELMDTTKIISSVAAKDEVAYQKPYNAHKDSSKQMTYKKIILKYSIPCSTHQRILEIDTANHSNVEFPHHITKETVLINDSDSDHNNEEVDIILSSNHLKTNKSTVDFQKFKTKHKIKHNPFSIKCVVCNTHFKSKKKLKMHTLRGCFPINV